MARRTRVLAAARPAVVLLSGALAVGGAGCAARRAARADLGIPPCAPGAGTQLLEAPALECWFAARHGRWRLMTQASHLHALVVDVAVDDLRDAGEIAHRFVVGERHRYHEIIVYAHRQPVTPASRVRRVRWTAATGYEAMEFGPPAEADVAGRAVPDATLRTGTVDEPGARHADAAFSMIPDTTR